jgi:hypothetical protein
VNLRLAAVAGLAAAALSGFAAPALADETDHGGLTAFHDVVVRQDQTVDGDLNVLFGNADIQGHVTGDVNVLGSCTVTDSAQIDGKERCIWNDGSAQALAPWLSAAGFGQVAEQDRAMFGMFAANAIVILAFLLFPLRMRLALDRVERHPALSAAVGFGALVLALPLIVITLCTIIGIPFVLLEIAALFVGSWIGQGAIALLVGRRLCELVMPRTTPAPLAALLLGLAVVSAAEIMPWFGWPVIALMWITGLGAATLGFFRIDGPGFAFERAPWSGPPMNPGAR